MALTGFHIVHNRRANGTFSSEVNSFFGRGGLSPVRGSDISTLDPRPHIRAVEGEVMAYEPFLIKRG